MFALQLSFLLSSTMVQYNVSINADGVLICLSMFHFILTLDKTPKIMTGAIHQFLVENDGLRFKGDDCHPSYFTLCCKVPTGA